MQREASACDLKELVGKFIPESIGVPPLPTQPLPFWTLCFGRSAWLLCDLSCAYPESTIAHCMEAHARHPHPHAHALIVFRETNIASCIVLPPVVSPPLPCTLACLTGADALYSATVTAVLTMLCNFHLLVYSCISHDFLLDSKLTLQVHISTPLQTNGKRGWSDAGKDIEKACQGIFPLQNTFVRKVKVLRSPKFDVTKLMEVGVLARRTRPECLERPAVPSINSSAVHRCSMPPWCCGWFSPEAGLLHR